MPQIHDNMSGPLTASQTQAVAFSIQGRAVSENPNNGPQGKGFQEGVAYTLEARHHVQSVAFQESVTGVREYDQSGCLRANGPGHDPVGTRVRSGMSVRRLTPTECERLQGFPDGYTKIPWRLHKEAQRKGVSYESLLLSRGIKLREPAGEECPDGPRYKALGNSMAVPCMKWIGERIAMIETAASLEEEEPRTPCEDEEP